MPAAPDPKPADEPPIDPRAVRALILLTMVAGMVDAVTFLGLDQVFAANMTGNLVVLGLALADAPTLSIDGPAVALAAFLAGAALAGRVERHGETRHYYVVRVVRFELLAIAIATVVAIVLEVDGQFGRLLIIGILAATMGARNEAIRRINLPELPTTVLTLAIAGFAAHEAEGQRDWGDRLRLVGIVTMVVGALISALIIIHTDVAWALAAITAVEALTLVSLGRTATGRGATVDR